MRIVIRDVPVRLAIVMASDCIAVAAVSTPTRTWSSLMPCAVRVGRPSSAMLPLASSASLPASRAIGSVDVSRAWAWGRSVMPVTVTVLTATPRPDSAPTTRTAST